MSEADGFFVVGDADKSFQLWYKWDNNLYTQHVKKAALTHTDFLLL